MKHKTTRERNLIELCNKIKKLKIISIEQLEELDDGIWKMLLSYRKTKDSRDNWKKKYYDLKIKFQELKNE